MKRLEDLRSTIAESPTAVCWSWWVMFAPPPPGQRGRLVRVCRPGGTIGLLGWTPGGFIGQMFATMKPYVPAPPAGRSRRRCGAAKTTSGPCVATMSPTSTRTGRPCASTGSPASRSSWTTSRQITDRRSPPTAASLMTQAGRRTRPRPRRPGRTTPARSREHRDGVGVPIADRAEARLRLGRIS